MRARETDEIVDGEEIIDVIPPPDQPQLVADQLADFRRQGRAIARLGRCLHQMVQIVEGLPSRRYRLVRIFVAQFVEREADTVEQSRALLDRFPTGREQPAHLGRRFQMAFAIGVEAPPCLVKRRALADTGDDVVERALRGGRVERIAGGKQRDVHRRRQTVQSRQPPRVGAAPGHGRGEPDRFRTCMLELAQQGLVATRRDQQQIVAMREQIFEVKDAVALLRAQIAGR